MVDNQPQEPGWIRSFIQAAPVRRALVLYGDVRDEFYDSVERQHLTLPEWLSRELRRRESLGFSIVGNWDRIDGLRFPDDRTAQRFRNAIAGKSNQAPVGADYDLGDNEAQPVTGSQPLYASPQELMGATRTLFENDAERPALILDWTHLLVGQAAHPDEDERNLILRLGKALVGGPDIPIDSDHLRHNTGLVVFLTAHLGNIPPILYQGDPRVQLIAVPPPQREERRAFFFRHQDDLRCVAPESTADGDGGPLPVQNDAVAETLADLTDRLTRVDLRQILALSMQTPEPLVPEKLLNLYRFGDQRSPWEELVSEKLRGVEDTLKRRVIGQDEAVHQTATMIIKAKMGVSGLQHSNNPSIPKGVLFFVGPPGVGKTELAKAAAEFLFGDESACIRFDMSEYSLEHSDQRLVGAPPGYVGFEEGGQLTNQVRERPFCVLLFDEIEKAHGRILDKFLQILADGRLTDGRGETTHFSQCVIIFTSNIGAKDAPQDAEYAQTRLHFQTAVENHLVSKLNRPELLDRIGKNIVVFDRIANDDFRRAIIEKQVNPLRLHLSERFGIGLQVAGSVTEGFLVAAQGNQGGRGLGNVIERDLLNPLAWFLFEHEHQLQKGRVLHVERDAEQLTFDLRDERR